MSYEWLKNVKVGDQVVESDSYEQRLATVTKLTDTQIVCGNVRFRRDNGWRIGGSSYARTHLVEATPERVEKITADKRWLELYYLTQHKRPAHVTADALRQVLALLKPAASP